MPITALLPLSSECRICGHPIRWTYSYVAVPGTHQAVFPPRVNKTTATRCPGGCGRTVNDADHPCDTCWDRLPTALRRGLLLSLAGVEVNTARIDVAAYFRDHPAVPEPGWSRPTGAQDQGVPA